MHIKILFITPYLPYPPISGGRLQTFLRIKSLKKRGHDIYLACIAEHGSTDKDIEELRRHVTEIEAVKAKVDITKVRFLLRKSLTLEIFSSVSGFEEKIRSFSKDKNIDVAVYEGIGAAQYRKAIDNIQSVIYEHNVEYEIIEQIVAYFRKSPLKVLKGRLDEKLKNMWLYLFGKREKELAREFELKVLKEFDLCITCSERDANILRKDVKDVPHVIVPWCIEVPLEFSKPKGKDIYNLVFVGSMYWEPNKDAIIWFIKEVMPLLRESLKNIRLIVVGSFMSREIYKLNNNRDIYIKGFIQDISEIWLNTDILVAPIRYGSGVNVKIIEAMSYGIPVVTTSKGAEGLNASGGKHFMLSNTPEEFFENIKCLIDNLEMRRSLSMKAREYISEHHEIDKVIDIFEKALVDVSKRKTCLI